MNLAHAGRIAVAIGSLALLSTEALAECLSSYRMCQDVYITRMVTDRAEVNIQTTGTLSNLSCTPLAGGYFQLEMSAPNAKEIYSHILTLHLQKRLASIRLSDSQSTCTVVYVYSDN